MTDHIGIVRKNKRNKKRHCLEWRIGEFLSLYAENGISYCSPPFSACNMDWSFLIYPNGINFASSGWVDIALRRLESGSPLNLRVTLGLKTYEGEENKREVRREFSEHDLHHWPRVCSRYDLKRQPGWMWQDTLRIAVEMILPIASKDACTQTYALQHIKQPSEKTDASIQTDVEFKEAGARNDGEISEDKQGIEKVAEDMEKLLVSGNKSDFTVQVKEAEFRVHSNILSARSPVLSAMLEHDMAEKSSNKIRIDDCESDVFEAYLRYIYTGCFKLPSPKTAFGLYSVADKYLADRLKLLCLKRIRNTLSVQTFCDTVRLALMHSEDDLLKFAIDFASRNLQSIIVTVEWQNFNCENPIEANEILIKCIALRK